MNSNHLNTDRRDERLIKIGAVSFFNSLPLIYGLESLSTVDVGCYPPAQLGGLLEAGEIDVGLTPSIAYQTSRDSWRILPVGGICSMGEVLTVRVFSRVAPAELEELACDVDSHTSVALARVIWHMRYGRRLKVRPIAGDYESAEAVLLIGDKVLGQLGKWARELDLGEAWTEETGLPFVYAFWSVREGGDWGQLVEILRRAVKGGVSNIEEIIQGRSARHGFGVEQARKYFAENIKFELGAKQFESLEMFYRLAYELGLTENNRRLNIYRGDMEQADQVTIADKK